MSLFNKWELGVEKIFCGAELMLLAVPRLFKEMEARKVEREEAFQKLIKEATENANNRHYRMVAEGRLDDAKKELTYYKRQVEAVLLKPENYDDSNPLHRAAYLDRVARQLHPNNS